jgi:selenide,water dikinase
VQVLRPLENLFNPAEYPDLLVGLGAPDDAAVWKLDDERALVVTTDFFTPVVDTPYEYGAIAAANSLSDVYAMGATPFLALNVAALPPDLPVEVGSEIIRGGADKCREAGVVIAGGHTVQDKEPKYGLVALGLVHPRKMLSKSGARAGDRLVLTKPLGFGVTTTALKQEKADPADIDEVIQWMSRLNRDAGRLASEFVLRGGTDVTGFSLLGHGLEMADASAVKLQIKFDQVPFISGAHKYAGMWTFPGGSIDNRVYYGPRVSFDGKISEMEQMLLFDAQTSGGLLLAVPEEKKDAFFLRANEIQQPAWEIGFVAAGEGIEVRK